MKSCTNEWWKVPFDYLTKSQHSCHFLSLDYLWINYIHVTHGLVAQECVSVTQCSLADCNAVVHWLIKRHRKRQKDELVSHSLTGEKRKRNKREMGNLRGKERKMDTQGQTMKAPLVNVPIFSETVQFHQRKKTRRGWKRSWAVAAVEACLDTTFEQQEMDRMRPFNQLPHTSKEQKGRQGKWEPELSDYKNRWYHPKGKCLWCMSLWGWVDDRGQNPSFRDREVEERGREGQRRESKKNSCNGDEKRWEKEEGWGCSDEGQRHISQFGGRPCHPPTSLCHLSVRMVPGPHTWQQWENLPHSELMG